MLKSLDKALHAALPEIVALRHELHQHPEIRFEERWTSDRIARFLDENGIPHTRGQARGTGVIGHIEGGAPGKTVVLRADMDALPMAEETGLAYASQSLGRMHACGHDGHMAVLCAAAKALAMHQAELHGAVRLIFQPAEEQAGGGSLIAAEGLLEDACAAFALHGWPELTVGQVGLRAGCVMASADFFRIDIEGQGAHGADPGGGVDPIVAAAHIIEALQTIASRETNPWDPVVVTVGRLEAGTAANIIPDHAWMEGTFRTVDPAVRQQVRVAIERIAGNVAQGLRARARTTFDDGDGYPPLITDAAMTAFAREVITRTLGETAAVELPHPYMTAEDFAFYLEKVPGTFLFLGLSEPGRPSPALHTSRFDFNDRALLPGALALSHLAAEFCASPQA
jgi:amidohydrolase/hippurate hydrolase